MIAPDFYAAAQQYEALGWRIVPVHVPTSSGCSCGEAGCGSPGKHPTISGWTERQAPASTWANGKLHNIGIVTGPASGIVAIDVDAGGEETLAQRERELGPLPATVTACTGAPGRHLLFKYPSGVIIRNDAKRRLGPGLDVRGDGGFIVAAPSLHKSGRRYEWMASLRPEDIAIAELPPAWIERLREPQRKPHAESRPPRWSGSRDRAYSLAALRDACAKVRAAPEGERNQTLNREAFPIFGFVGSGLLSREEVEESFTAAALDAGLRQSEIRATLRSAAAGEREPRHAPPRNRNPGEDDGDEEPPPSSGENPPGRGAPRGAHPEWSDPIPFDRVDVPGFPTRLLPDWHRRIVEAVACETETPPDLAALSVLTATAATCARRFGIEQRPGFCVPANLWTLTMMSSGNRKSAVFDRAVAPLREYESRKESELAVRIATDASARRRLEARLRKAEKAAADAKEETQRRAESAAADQLAEELASFRVTRAPRLFLSEASPERLEEVLAEQGGRTAVLAAEPALFRALAGLGSRANQADPNLASILDAYDGGDVRVGRMKRDNGSGGDRIVRGAVVTIGLAPQPERVFAALRAGPAFLESGFAWRFLFALPPSKLGQRTHATPAAPESVLAEYAARMRELLEMPEARESDPLPVLHMTAEARDALLAFERALEPAMAEGGQLAAAVPWASKLTSKLARIAGLLHAAEHRREPWLSPLELPTMERAIALADYFIPHARSVLLELGADETVRSGRRVLAWIRREHRTTVSRRDVHRAAAKNEAAGTWLDRLVQLLVDHEYLRPQQPGQRTGGRPASPLYEVNPNTFRVQHAE